MTYDNIFPFELLAQNGARPHLCDSNIHSHLKDERKFSVWKEESSLTLQCSTTLLIQ